MGDLLLVTTRPPKAITGKHTAGAAYMHVLFHPDYDRRLWNFARSADLRPTEKLVKALAGLQVWPEYRRWGISPRPENIQSLAKSRIRLQ